MFAPVVQSVTGSVVTNSTTPRVGVPAGYGSVSGITNSPSAQSTTNAAAGHASVSVVTYGLMQDRIVRDAGIYTTVDTSDPTLIMRFSTETTQQAATAYGPVALFGQPVATAVGSATAYSASVRTTASAGAATAVLTYDFPVFDTSMPTGRLVIKPEDRTYVIASESRTKAVGPL